MSKIIAIANQKGGVGKTSTANGLSARLHDLGYAVLAIDMDPQGNLSSSVNVKYDEHTILDVLRGIIPAKEAIQHPEPFDVIPSNILLAGYEQELIASNFGREIRLKRSISSISEDYDYIIVDTAPSLGMLTINALTAADEVLVPATPEFFAASGLEQLVDTVKNVREYAGNQKLAITGILYTQVEPRTLNGQAIREATASYARKIGIRVFQTYIRKAVAMGESQTNRLDIFEFAPNSNVAKDYASFVKEYLTDLSA